MGTPRKKTPLISIQYASKSYDDDPLNFDHLVLRNVNLEIYDGEFVVIFGPSGSGKSSLLNLIAALEKPTAGRVMLRRRDLAHFTHKELAKYHRLKMGMVFQSFNLIKSLNVWENVALPQTANGISYKPRKRRALKLLSLFGLEEYPERHANELSGGEQQRVAIARALINNPYFLLVDEPTGNLDSKSAAEVMKIFYGLNKHGKHTIVMVTHNPEQLQFASRVIYVQDGQVVRDERRDEVEHEMPAPMNKEHMEELGQYRDVVPHDHDDDGDADHEEAGHNHPAVHTLHPASTDPANSTPEVSAIPVPPVTPGAPTTPPPAVAEAAVPLPVKVDELPVPPVKAPEVKAADEDKKQGSAS